MGSKRARGTLPESGSRERVEKGRDLDGSRGSGRTQVVMVEGRGPETWSPGTKGQEGPKEHRESRLMPELVRMLVRMDVW